MGQSARISKNEPEVYFIVCRNTEASADMADGEVVVYDVTTTAGRIQGKDVIKSTAASQLTVAGVVFGVIKNMQLGRVQVFGFHPNVKTTTATLAASAVVNSDAAAAALGAVVEGAYLGVCLKLGVNNRAGIMIKCMGG
jgi:hypothetical protein